MSYSATTQTRPLGKELTNQNVTRKQKIAIFFLKQTDNIKEYFEGRICQYSSLTIISQQLAVSECPITMVTTCLSVFSCNTV